MKSIFSILFSFLIFNSICTGETKIKEIGGVKIVIKTPITVVEQAQAINYFDSDTGIIGNAKANIESCKEKFSFRKKSIKVDLRCYIILDDKSPGIMEYVAILIGNEKLNEKF